MGLRATGLHRAVVARGLGAILTFHHIRPYGADRLRMMRGLEITPDFFSVVLETLTDLGFDLVSLDTLSESLAHGGGPRPFAALTFDDGYLDNLEFAAPLLRAYAVPYTIYVTSGFADGTTRAWWEDLEAAIRRLPQIRIRLGEEVIDLPAATWEQKEAAADLISARLRRYPQEDARQAVSGLLAAAACAGTDHGKLFMDWDDLRLLAQDPLCTIGVHTLTHSNLAQIEPAQAIRELEESRRLIEERIGKPAKHLAYPFGHADAAGPREFALARDLGFASAVTTRPGMIFKQHADHMTALPRLSVNGVWQSREALEILLSGLPFAVWNRGRRLNVA